MLALATSQETDAYTAALILLEPVTELNLEILVHVTNSHHPVNPNISETVHRCGSVVLPGKK